MDNCPNCNNEICANAMFTHMVNFFDMLIDEKSVEIHAVDLSFMTSGYPASSEYLEKLRKPRVISSLVPLRVPDIGDMDFFDAGAFQSITVTCKKTPWIFHYAETEIDVEILDN